MFGFFLKLSDWTLDQYKIILQILSGILIIIMLVYVGLSNKKKE